MLSALYRKADSCWVGEKMKLFEKLSLAAFLILVIWFTLDLIGIPGLVTPDSLWSLAGLLEAVLLLLVCGHLLQWKYSDGVTLLVMITWGYFQYQAHWQYYLFGASFNHIQRYNQFYSGMYRFFAQSSTKIIPDAYHTLLAGLIILNFLVITVKLVLHGRRRL